MASNENRANRRVPVVLRIKLRYRSVDTFIEKFATNISSGGMFIRSRTPKQVDTKIKFELRLADDSPVITGYGVVRWTKDYDPDHPRADHGMGIEFTKVNKDSRAVIDRIVEHKREHGLDVDTSIPVPGATAPATTAVEPPQQTGDAKDAAPPPPRPQTPVATESPPLEQRHSRKPAIPVAALIARATESVAAPDTDDLSSLVDGDMPALDDVLVRARQLARGGSSSDGELDQLLRASVAPTASSVADASASLAALFGGVAVARRSSRAKTNGSKVVVTDPEPAPEPEPVELAPPPVEQPVPMFEDIPAPTRVEPQPGPLADSDMSLDMFDDEADDEADDFATAVGDQLDEGAVDRDEATIVAPRMMLNDTADATTVGASNPLLIEDALVEDEENETIRRSLDELGLEAPRLPTAPPTPLPTPLPPTPPPTPASLAADADRRERDQIPLTESGSFDITDLVDQLEAEGEGLVDFGRAPAVPPPYSRPEELDLDADALDADGLVAHGIDKLGSRRKNRPGTPPPVLPDSAPSLEAFADPPPVEPLDEIDAALAALEDEPSPATDLSDDLASELQDLFIESRTTVRADPSAPEIEMADDDEDGYDIDIDLEAGEDLEATTERSREEVMKAAAAARTRRVPSEPGLEITTHAPEDFGIIEQERLRGDDGDDSESSDDGDDDGPKKKGFFKRIFRKS